MNIFKIILLIGTLVGVLDTKGCPGDKAKALSASFPQLAGIDAEKLSVGDFANFGSLEDFTNIESIPTVNSVQSEEQETVVEDDEIIFEDDHEEAQEAQSDEPAEPKRRLVVGKPLQAVFKLLPLNRLNDEAKQAANKLLEVFGRFKTASEEEKSGLLEDLRSAFNSMKQSTFDSMETIREGMERSSEFKNKRLMLRLDMPNVFYEIEEKLLKLRLRF